MTAWFLYVLECRDGSLYTGITVNVQKRFDTHKAGKGAKYTRSHPPQRVLAIVEYADRSAASRAEHAVKLLPLVQKRLFCEQHAVMEESAG